MASGSRRSRGSAHFVPNDEVDPRPLVHHHSGRRSVSRGSFIAVGGRNRNSVTASYRSRQGSQVDFKSSTEETDRSYTNYPTCCTVMLFVVVAWALFAGGFFLGCYFYHERMTNRAETGIVNTTKLGSESVPAYWKDPIQMVAVHIDIITHGISEQRISHRLSEGMHAPLTGSSADENLVREVEEALHRYSLDSVKIEKYDILLPVSDIDKPNKLEIIDKNSTVLHSMIIRNAGKAAIDPNAVNSRSTINQNAEARKADEGHFEPQDGDNLQIPPFIAYSPSANATKGELIYLHYGCNEDTVSAQQLQVPLAGRIALVQLGKCSISTKARHLKSKGLKAVILYMEQSECDDSVPYGSMVENGDPFTAGIPAVGGVMVQSLDEFSTAQLPMQTVSCKTARDLLGRLQGVRAPAAWQCGGRDTIHIGRKSSKAGPWTVQLSIDNAYEIKPVYNVIGTIQGREDDDQYVMVGASRTGFPQGGSGLTVGTSLLLEFAESLSRQVRATWRPRRTIKLCSWGGSEYGNLGMVEFLESYNRVLFGKSAGYIDLDHPVSGRDLTMTVSPSLQSVLSVVAHRVFTETGNDYENPRFVNALGVSDTPLGNHMPLAHIQYLDPQVDAWLAPYQDLSLRDNMQVTTVLRLSAFLILSLGDAALLPYHAEKTVERLKFLLMELSEAVAEDTSTPSLQLQALLHDTTSELSFTMERLQEFATQYLYCSQNNVLCRQLSTKLMRFEAYAAEVSRKVTTEQTRYLDELAAGISTDWHWEQVFIGFFNDCVQLQNLLEL